jgi:hypothetical protein
LTSEYGGERLRPDDGSVSCMSRTPVGLANHPAIKLKWQLSVAHGCLIGSPSCRALPVGLVRASDSRLAEPVFRAGKVRYNPEIAEPRACRLAFGKAKKQ